MTTSAEFMLRDLAGDRVDVFTATIAAGENYPGHDGAVYLVSDVDELVLSGDQALELALALLKAREALSS